MKKGISKGTAPLQIGSRLELFVDDWLVDEMKGLRFELQKPADAGMIFDLTMPWEGHMSGTPTVFKDGDRFRMYYRGARREMQKGRPGSSCTCYAESIDGINWTKPNLGLYEFNGSRENNITYIGDGTPQWHGFKDENPEAPPERRYKAICGITLGYGGPKGTMSSSDGLHWEWWRKEPVIVGGPLDTHNTSLWDPESKLYMAFLRNWVSRKKGFDVPPDPDTPPDEYHRWAGVPDRVRAITRSTSKDYVNWSPQEWLIYDGDPPLEHLYTNAVAKYARAPHMFVGFPMRFIPDRETIRGWAGSAIARTAGLADALFMNSRDGLHWDRRFKEAFLRPGLDERNWVNHGNFTCSPGVMQTGPDEMSLYYVSHWQHDDIHLRRSTLRLDGFVSVHAGYPGGELITRPLVFSGGGLAINYATSAAGSVRAEIQDASGEPLPGFKLEDCPEIYGDHIARRVAWRESGDLSSLAGRPVRLRFVMKDADLFALQFHDKQRSVA